MLFVVLVVSTHAYLGLYVHIIHVYAKPDCMPIKYSYSYKTKFMSAVCANQKCTQAFRAKLVAHGSRIMSLVYMHVMCIDSYGINFLCTRRIFCMHFQIRVKSCSCYTGVQSCLN